VGSQEPRRPAAARGGKIPAGAPTIEPLGRFRRGPDWAGAAAGLAIGIALGVWLGPIGRPPDLPGAAHARGIDPRGDLVKIAIAILAAAAGAYLARRAAGLPRRGRTPGSRALAPWRFPTDTAIPAASAALFPAALAAFSALVFLRGPLSANMFEDGHALLPASVYLSGGLPYRDIVPGHGLFSDGLAHAGELALFGDDYAGLKQGGGLVGSLFWPAFFAAGWAATGSPALGAAAAGLTFLVSPQYCFFRLLAPLAALALALSAARHRSRWRWWLAGAALPFSLLFAVELSLDSLVAAAAALLVARGSRCAAAGAFAAGLASGAAAVAAVLAAIGVLGPFCRTTLVDLPRLAPVYSLGLPEFPHSFAAAVRLAAELPRTGKIFFPLLAAASILAAVLLVRAPAVGQRARPLLPLAVWFLAASSSVVERRHYEYPLYVAPLAAVLAARWLVSRRTLFRVGLAATGLFAVILFARPVSLGRSLAARLASEASPVESAAVGLPRRCRGARFAPADAAMIKAVGAFLGRERFAPGDTWFDFSNTPLLYYLWERRCPIRYYEVGFYETEAAQKEVIAALERDSAVRAVLISTGSMNDSIDGIPNGERAPLVDGFLRANFRPSPPVGSVVFWTRVR
jgi:hypothetical protein